MSYVYMVRNRSRPASAYRLAAVPGELTEGVGYRCYRPGTRRAAGWQLSGFPGQDEQEADSYWHFFVGRSVSQVMSRRTAVRAAIAAGVRQAGRAEGSPPRQVLSRYSA